MPELACLVNHTSTKLYRPKHGYQEVKRKTLPRELCWKSSQVSQSSCPGAHFRTRTKTCWRHRPSTGANDLPQAAIQDHRARHVLWDPKAPRVTGSQRGQRTILARPHWELASRVGTEAGILLESMEFG